MSDLLPVGASFSSMLGCYRDKSSHDGSHAEWLKSCATQSAPSMLGCYRDKSSRDGSHAEWLKSFATQSLLGSELTKKGGGYE